MDIRPRNMTRTTSFACTEFGMKYFPRHLMAQHQYGTSVPQVGWRCYGDGQADSLSKQGQYIHIFDLESDLGVKWWWHLILAGDILYSIWQQEKTPWGCTEHNYKIHHTCHSPLYIVILYIVRNVTQLTLLQKEIRLYDDLYRPYCYNVIYNLEKFIICCFI